MYVIVNIGADPETFWSGSAWVSDVADAKRYYMMEALSVRVGAFITEVRSEVHTGSPSNLPV